MYVLTKKELKEQWDRGTKMYARKHGNASPRREISNSACRHERDLYIVRKLKCHGKQKWNFFSFRLPMIKLFRLRLHRFTCGTSRRNN